MRAVGPLLISGLVLSAVPALAASDGTERKLRQAMAYAQQGQRALEKGNRSKAAESFRADLAKSLAGRGAAAN